MSGGKGGRSNKEVTMPKFAETALQQGIGMEQDVSQTGYVPYYGPEVAAFSPMQEAAFQGTDMAASAFGMPTTGGQQYLPEAQTFAGGMKGYSSAPMFEEAVATLAEKRPGQAEYLESFTIDPITGEPGSRAASNQPVSLEMSGGRRGK